ncbi:MAG: ammonia-forming cytochrome c nitrite reductase subunit c552 [Sulfuricella sp.]|nr:ammonia-forming cytochrome c nitrite reductase subunit c552 [Sulfuricella sp.]
MEASLAPSACGTCHPRQFEDWKSALHSRAMSPGLFGQLQEMGAAAGDDHQACLQCHAPLAEQGEHLRQTLANAPHSVPPRPDGVSHAHGLTCAGCHVRNRQVFGPPRKDGSAPPRQLPHDGWQATDAFEDSRFCAACHQFEADGPTLNGKLLENTYEEWRASRHARENRSCQSCHMPDRRHLWRGIHDPEMVKSGLGIESSPPIISKGQVSAQLQITNRAVGHAFPTYVTPRVWVEIGQESAGGKMIASTIERHLIARDVSLDLTMEKSDTRIMPDETRRYVYRRNLHPRAIALTTRIVVEPDAFYADFYRATLKDQDVRIGRKAIDRALQHAEQTPYAIYLSRQKVP